MALKHMLANSVHPDKTAWTCSLIWIYAGHKYQQMHFKLEGLNYDDDRNYFQMPK